MTPLDKSLKRALTINGHDYVVTLTPEALKITRKGHRLGVELKWASLVSGESALAVALHASVGKFQDDVPKRPAAPKDVARRPSATSPRRSTAASPRRSTATSPRRASAASARSVGGEHTPPKRSR